MYLGGWMDTIRYILIFYAVFFVSSVFADTYPAKIQYKLQVTPNFTADTRQQVCDLATTWILTGYEEGSRRVELSSNGTNCDRINNSSGWVEQSYGILPLKTCPYGGSLSGDYCISAPACPDGYIRNTTGECQPPPPTCPPSGENRPIAVCHVDSQNESNGTLNINISGDNSQKTSNFEGCVYNYQVTDFMPEGAGGSGCYVSDAAPVNGQYEVCCVYNGTSTGEPTTSPDNASMPDDSPSKPLDTSDDGKCKTDSNGNQVCSSDSPSPSQQCGTVNGAKVCVDTSDTTKPPTINGKPIDLQGKNCGWVNGVLKCVDDSPASPTTEGCVVGSDGRTYCVNRDVKETTTETTTTNPDGTITTTKTTDKNIIGDDPDVETTTTNPDGSKSTTKSGDDGQGTSDCEKNPDTLGCQDLGGTVPSSDPISHYDVPITWNYTSFGSGGSCPADIPALTQINASWSFQPVCDFASGLRPILVALAFLLAGRIVLGGIKE